MTFLRTRRCRRLRCSSLVSAHANDPCYFADLPALRMHALAGVADALALVRLGLADLADVGRDLTDQLLVEAAHDDARRLRNLERDAGRCLRPAPGARSRPRARSRPVPAPRRGSRRRRSRAPWRSPRRRPPPCWRSAMRWSPCNDRFDRVVVDAARRRACRRRVSTATPPTISCSSWPFGPFTVTCAPSIVTSTPLGTVIGCFPMRDMMATPLPDLAQDLAADLALARFPVGQQTLVGGQDRDPHAAEHRRHRRRPSSRRAGPVGTRASTRRSCDGDRSSTSC